MRPLLMTLPFSVVGFYPETGETFVEWVESSTVNEAINNAIAIDGDRKQAIIVAVFEGHMVDKWLNQGLASGETSIEKATCYIDRIEQGDKE